MDGQSTPKNVAVFKITDEDIANALETPNVNELVENISDMKIAEPTTDYCTSDSDNQSIISISDDTLSDNSTKSLQYEFVVVQTPTCFKPDVVENTEVANEVKPVEIAEENFDRNNNQNSSSESIAKVDEACSESSQKSEVSFVTTQNPDDDFEIISVRGKQIPVSKKYIDGLLKTPVSVNAATTEEAPVDLSARTRVLSAASSVEIVNFREEETQADQIKAEDEYLMGMSHCSAAGSCFSDVNQPSIVPEKTFKPRFVIPDEIPTENNSRLFIFPQQRPGYEVLQTSCGNVAEIPQKEETPWYQNSAVRPAHMIDTFNSTEGNYQQTRQPIIASAPSPFDTPLIPNSTQQNIENAEFLLDQQQQQLENQPRSENQESTHGYILPDTLVSGAVNVASSAINTARSVINMIKTKEQPGRWVNGHWVSSSPETPREANLRALAEMGFWDRNLNATLLARYNDDLNRVVLELVQ